MPRGQVVVESRESEAGVCFTLQLVAVGSPGVGLALEFFRTFIHSEIPSEKSRKALRRAFGKPWWRKPRRKGDDEAATEGAPWTMAKLVDLAVEYYECEPECKENLHSLFAEVRRGKWDESFTELRKALEKSKMPTRYAYDAVEWIMKEITGNPGLETRFSHANTPELWKACVCDSWARLVLSDMLLRSGTPANREAVWKKLGEMGIEFDEMFKNRIVSYVQGKTYEGDVYCLLTDAAHDSEVHWKYNEEAFELARHQWTEKWADLFAEYLNQSKQGIATYYRRGGLKIGLDDQFGLETTNEPAGDVLEWIRYNTHFAPWKCKVEKFCKTNLHSRFLRHLGEYCKVRWSDDVHKELEEYGRSLRSRGNDQSQGNKTKEFEEKIGSLGLNFSPATISLITQQLQRPCSLRHKHQLDWRRPPIKLLASHKFEVDPGKVSQRNATYIKAALGQPADVENCKICGACARKPDDSCFFSGAGRFASFEYAINYGLKSGMLFQDSPATTVDDCGENRARRLQTVSRQHEHTPLPALKLLRTARGREISEIVSDLVSNMKF